MQKELLLTLFKSQFVQITDISLINEIIGQAQLKNVLAQEQLLDYGQVVRFVPLVLSGSIKILRADEDGREMLLYYLNSGQTCALSLSCCSRNKPSEIRAVAEEDATLLMIPTYLHEDLSNKYRQWKEFMAQTYADRFKAMLEAFDSVAFKHMDERLINYLRQKSAQLNTLELSLTHQEIANELATSREVISRLLKQLEQLGSIQLARQKVVLLKR